MKVNFVGKCIEVSNAEMKRAQNYDSQEFEMLMRVTKELPDFQIAVKQASHKTYNPYARLTYEMMEHYIETFDPDRVKEFQAIRVTYRSYPAVKRWFLEAFPEVNENLWFAA